MKLSHSLPFKDIFPKKPPKLPSKIVWQVEYAIRTAYATAICFIFVYYVQWGTFTTIAPVFSAMSTTMYFGVWQRTYWTVLVSSSISSVVGAIVGLTWHHSILLIFLIFFSILWIGKCTIWNPTAKTFGGVTFILCALYPLISNGTVSTFQIVAGILLTTNVPFLLTGVTLLFPYPRFSHTRCQQSLELLADRYSRILCDYIDAYCNSEESDLFLSLAKGHILEAKNLLQLMGELSINIDSESYLFPELTKYSENILQLIPLLKKILDELTAMGTILPDIIRNETHAMHIKVMKTTLRQTALQFRSVLMIITISHMKKLIPINFCLLPLGRDWIPRFDYSPSQLIMSLRNWLFGCYESILAIVFCKPHHQIANSSDPTRGVEQDVLEAIDSLLAFQQALLSSAQCARDDYVFIRPPTSVVNLPINDSGSTTSPLHAVVSPIAESKGSTTSLNPKIHHLSPLQVYERSVYQSISTQPTKNVSPSDKPVSTFIPPSKSLTIREDSELSISLSVQEFELVPTPPSPNEVSLPPPIPSPKRARSISWSDHPPLKVSYSESQASSETTPDDIESATKDYVPSQDCDTESIVSWRYAHRHSSIYENTTIDKDTGMQTNYATILYFENLRYGTHNWSPRLSFLATLLSLMDIVGDMKQLNREPTQEPKVEGSTSRLNYLKSYIKINVWRFQRNYPVLSEIISNIIFSLQYLYESLFEPYRICHMLYRLLSFYFCNPRSVDSSCSQQITEYRHYLHHYIHPTKIAFITTVCSLFVILPYFQNLFPFGLWGVIVVTLIRQDNSSSSFSRGFQRIEGTVLGCIYAYMLSLLFNCEEKSCFTPSVVSLVVLWLGICAYFREGIHRGYAAIVAGFTPIIVLLGSARGSQAGAWARVQMTVIGVSIYLIVDNIILPSRADVAIRKNIISTVSHVTKILSASSQALNGLFSLAKDEASSTQESGPCVEMAPSDSISPGGSILADFDADDDEISNYLSVHVSKNMKHLETVNLELSRLTLLVSEQSTLLQLAALEPELWHRPFPLNAYQSLNRCLEKVVLSARSLYTAILYLHKWAQGETSLREFRRHVDMISKMNQYLLLIVVKAETSLQAQESSLKRILNGIHSNESDAEDMKTISSMITLSRIVEDVLRKLDQESRQYYFQQTTTDTQRTNIEFAVHWLNIQICIEHHMRNLTKLGIELLNVRNMESQN